LDLKGGKSWITTRKKGSAIQRGGRREWEKWERREGFWLMEGCLFSVAKDGNKTQGGIPLYDFEKRGGPSRKKNKKGKKKKKKRKVGHRAIRGWVKTKGTWVKRGGVQALQGAKKGTHKMRKGAKIGLKKTRCRQGGTGLKKENGHPIIEASMGENL